MTKVFKNTTWTKRNYDCTNLVLQVTPTQPVDYQTGEVDLVNWVEVDPEEVADMEELSGEEYPVTEGFQHVGGIGKSTFWGFM